MGGKNERWARVNLSGQNGGASIHLEVNGHKLPVSHFVAQYGINQIPQAAIFVPLGTNVAPDRMDSPVSDAIDELLAFTPATLRLTGNLGDAAVAGDAFGRRVQFPPGPAVLFTGYLRGVVYRRVHGQLGLIINLSNQLIALTLSSAGSGEFIPGSPEDLFHPTIYSGTGVNYSTATNKFIGLMKDTIGRDFSAAVLSCVRNIAKDSLLQLHDYDRVCNWPKAGGRFNENTMALKALEAGDDWRGMSNLAFDGTPYPLKLLEAEARVAQYVGARFAQSLASTNLWGMMAYAVVADFGMAILPTATTAYLAPLLKAANESAYAIYPDEYADVTMTAGALLPLYGVALVRQQPLGTDGLSQQGTTACVGGSYSRGSNGTELKSAADGMWMYLRAPAWLDNFPMGRIAGVDTAPGLSQLMSGASTEVSGGVLDTVPAPANPGHIDLSTMLNLFAKMRFAENLLRGREGTVIGKLRFDIAPGTLLRVVGKTRDKAQQSRSEATDSLATDMIGCVSQVTIAINAQQSSATTSFRLTDLRTAKENEREGMSMPQHPFFGENYFKHAPLVPELTP